MRPSVSEEVESVLQHVAKVIVNFKSYSDKCSGIINIWMPEFRRMLELRHLNALRFKV